MVILLVLMSIPVHGEDPELKAVISGDFEGLTTDDTVTFDGSNSTGNISHVYWYITPPYSPNNNNRYIESASMKFTIELDIPGNYMAQLRVYSNTNELDYVEMYFNVIDTTPPEIEPIYNITVNQNENITLPGQKVHDNGYMMNYTWTVGGTYHYGENPTFTIADVGTYVSTLIVQDWSNNENSTSFWVIVKDITPPVLSLVYDNNINQHDTVDFSVDGSTDNYLIKGCLWIINGTEYNESHISIVFDESGNYDCYVEIFDMEGNTASQQFNVTVNDITKPTIRITVDGVVPDNGTVYLNHTDALVLMDCSQSTDNEGIESIKWQIENDVFTDESFIYRFGDEGDYGVYVTITDVNGLKSSELYHIVVSIPPKEGTALNTSNTTDSESFFTPSILVGIGVIGLFLVIILICIVMVLLARTKKDKKT